MMAASPSPEHSVCQTPGEVVLLPLEEAREVTQPVQGGMARTWQSRNQTHTFCAVWSSPIKGLYGWTWDLKRVKRRAEGTASGRAREG